MKTTKKFQLAESEIPRQWYNIKADMPNQPRPLLNPQTREALKPEEMEGLFAKELVAQEFSAERWIDIPEEVVELYKIYRPTPLVRAYKLEKELDTPAKIYFKNESVSPVGSHKLNTAIAQAYYNSKQGIMRLTTETGAGQWGSAMSVACGYFGIELVVFMVKQSYEQKPYRKIVINTYGGKVHASPSALTNYGRSVLESDPLCRGSLGMAISEAVEMAVTTPDTRYSLGSVLNHVLLHQTIIGLEAEKQMEMAGDYPTKVIACFGGGSNFSGISFPFLRHKFTEGRAVELIAAEPAACPKLTKGVLEYDFGDTAGMTPLIPMYTLGHDFQPEQIHAAGLRYHGGGQIVSQLKADGFVNSCAIEQQETFAAGRLFAKTEGIIPAPESCHAIAATIREAIKAKEAGRSEVLLFNLSGHGLLDMAAYENGL
ncbi:MAG: TrpB-like pyridoxal phosphate-dependent enzyme [Bacteroidetes bacterium HGW-Bacteroidetes-8]|jgi:tryptophan synthase beta chain|nr:MAG: TrpB-like pyridoxal phosphate-dependent enzyme [Bacteroidetes bacterium HGW-Bacteroidetes-8]